MNLVSLLPTRGAQFLSENEGLMTQVEVQIGSKGCGLRQVQLGQWRQSIREEGGTPSEAENRVQERGGDRGRRRGGTHSRNPLPETHCRGGTHSIWEHVLPLCQGTAPGHNRRPNNRILFLLEDRDLGLLWEGKVAAFLSKTAGQLCWGSFPAPRAHRKISSAWNLRNLHNWTNPSSARKRAGQLCLAAGCPGSDFSQIPLLHHMFPEISVLGNESDCPGGPELPIGTTPCPAQAIMREANPERGGLQREGVRRPGLSGTYEGPDIGFLLTTFTQRVLLSRMELVAGVNSTKSWPLPLRSSQF